MISDEDQRFMRIAIRAAQRGADRPLREPLAGAVVVVNGRVVGKGYTSDRGPDALAAALDTATEQTGELPDNATIYTNFIALSENQADALLTRLIDSRVGRVVVGGTGAPDQLNRFRAEGIKVDTSVCEQDCRAVNEKYFKYAETGLPFVTVKFAQSLDGRIATATGDSQWISSSGARRFAHQLRREHDAIMVGIGTVLADDPQLSVRLVRGRDPLRVVVDSSLRIPLTCRVLSDGAAKHTFVATSEGASISREQELASLGATVLRLPSGTDNAGINMKALLEGLARHGIASVLVEGGKGIITALLAARAVDRLVSVVAPKIIGEGIEAIGNLSITRLDDAITFSSVKTRKLGPDVVFDGRLN